MKQILWLAVFAVTVSIGLPAQSIEYFVEKPGDSLYNTLRAKANGMSRAT